MSLSPPKYSHHQHQQLSRSSNALADISDGIGCKLRNAWCQTTEGRRDSSLDLRRSKSIDIGYFYSSSTGICDDCHSSAPSKQRQLCRCQSGENNKLEKRKRSLTRRLAGLFKNKTIDGDHQIVRKCYSEDVSMSKPRHGVDKYRESTSGRATWCCSNESNWQDSLVLEETMGPINVTVVGCNHLRNVRRGNL